MTVCPAKLSGSPFPSVGCSQDRGLLALEGLCRVGGGGGWCGGGGGWGAGRGRGCHLGCCCLLCFLLPPLFALPPS